MEDPIFFVINYAFDAYFIVEVRVHVSQVLVEPVVLH